MEATHDQVIAGLVQSLSSLEDAGETEKLLKGLVSASQARVQDPVVLRELVLLILERMIPPNPPLQAFVSEFGPETGPLICESSACMRAVVVYFRAQRIGVQITEAEMNAKCSDAVQSVARHDGDLAAAGFGEFIARHTVQLDVSVS